MADTIKEALQEQLERDSRFLSNVVRMQSAIKDLGIENLKAYICVQSYAFGEELPMIDITPSHEPGIGIFMEPDKDRAFTTSDGKTMAPVSPNLRMVDTTPLLSQIARKILPVVGKFEKGFDADRNQVSLTAIYQGIKIIIKDTTPKTCSVERVEEEIDVPEKIIPAHKEKKVSYKLVGDCDPILADEAAHVVTAQGAIPVETTE